MLVAVDADASWRQGSGMTALRVRLGKAIVRLRANAELSQERLAAKAKIHRTTMSEVERGLTNISVDIAERIAKGLGVSLSRLFEEAEHG
jgi:transcriptional regulator with XRE-family HTH domain